MPETLVRFRCFQSMREAYVRPSSVQCLEKHHLSGLDGEPGVEVTLAGGCLLSVTGELHSVAQALGLEVVHYG